MEGVEVERVFLASTHGSGTTQLFFYAWLYLKMLWRGMRTSFDVVHCHDLDTLAAGFRAGQAEAASRLCTMPTRVFRTCSREACIRVVRAGLVHLENFLIRRIDLLITVGEKLRRHFAEQRRAPFGGGGQLEAARRIFRGPSSRTWRCAGGSAFRTARWLVVCITQLLKDRKIEELLAAVEDCPDVYVIVGGKGVLEDLVRAGGRGQSAHSVRGLRFREADCGLYLRRRRRLLRIRSREPQCPVQRAEQTVRSAGRRPAADHRRFRRDRRRGARGGVRDRAAAITARRRSERRWRICEDRTCASRWPRMRSGLGRHS